MQQQQQHQAPSSKFNRIDYVQVGLTSKNAFKMVRRSGQLVELVIGDHAGSLHLFTLRTDSNQIETVFKTLPGPNAKINCVEVFSGASSTSSSSAVRILAASGSSTIKGYNKKGKQFFCLELNNLTEPIKLFKMRWPDEIYVVGQYIYNSYSINTETLNANSGSNHFNISTSSSKSSAFNSVVKSKHYYVCPEKINDLIMLEDKFNRRTIPVLACQDRLLRVLKDSACSFEVEICGIPSVVQVVPKFAKASPSQSQAFATDLSTANKRMPKNEDVQVIYGTLDGKIALVTFHFVDKNQLEPLHKWEVPVNAIKQPVTCLQFSETTAEFFVGRSDGSVEVWRLNEAIDDDNVQSVDLTIAPSLVDVYNCGESVTSIVAISANDQPDSVLLCSTFTGLVFGLVKHAEAFTQRQLNPNYLIISKDNATKIEALKEECEKLEKKLDVERQKYEQHTSSQGASEFVKETNLSALPFFTINDSFVLHNDASYVLMLEVEVAMDVVFIHCDIGLDLIDCERNSAVISFNEPNENDSNEILATFRCQANTTRLEIRLRPVEGQHGTLTVNVISRITPKSCQTRTYAIQPLSLHKRQYSNTQIEFANSLDLSGTFGLNDAHTWLRMCIPEIPEKLTLTMPDVESEVFYYVSTMTKSILICNCGKGKINLMSDNVSTISILKDFLTREATRQSIPIEISVEVEEKSIGVILRQLYPLIKNLILEKQRNELYEAISDLQSSDADIATQLLKDLHLEGKTPEDTVKQGQKRPESTEANKQDVLIGLDRIQGIITDLFIDYHKMKGNSMVNVLRTAKQKLPEMATLMEKIVLESINEIGIVSESSQDRNDTNSFVEKLFQFWEVQT